jgi:predicted phosphohydrolase
MDNSISFIDIILLCGENSDAWEDVYFAEAYHNYLINKSGYSLIDLVENSKQLNNQNQERFWQVVSAVEQLNEFEMFLTQIGSQPLNIAIYIIDGLREWNLNSKQKEELRESAEKLKGVSQVYDLIIQQI